MKKHSSHSKSLTSRNLALFALAFLVSGCSAAFQPPLVAPPQIAERTMSGDLLASLPPARQKVVVSVYEFQDQTGQQKPNDTFADYSRAVTQGGLSILNKALLDAANKGWFTVIERGGLKNLLQERQIIKVTRSEYMTPGQQSQPIQPLLYAGMIIEGGIVSYESNVVTGGAGAKYLGIGGDTQYRRDIVTVYLRAISSQTGEVLLSVNTSKTIYSTSVTASIFKYVSFDHLLELETGFTANEPPQFAVRQAIEMGVYSMIMEGAINNLWEFSDHYAGRKAIRDYLARRDGKQPGEYAKPATPKEVKAVTNPPPVVPGPITPAPAISIDQSGAELRPPAQTQSDQMLPENPYLVHRHDNKRCYAANGSPVECP